jgi:hypothetical protein
VGVRVGVGVGVGHADTVTAFDNAAFVLVPHPPTTATTVP